MSIGYEMKGIAKPLTKLLWLLAFALPLHAAAETVEYIHTDALGTPIAVTDASGNLIETSEYEPYGKLLNRPLTDGPGFTGHVEDAATGLTYMQQRYYDPVVGRFLSVDPVTADSVSGSNFNRYWYADNNPYRFVDPDGRCTGSNIADIDGKCPNGEYTTQSSAGTYVPGGGRAPQLSKSQRDWVAFKSRLGIQGDLTKNGNIFDFESLAYDLIPPILDTPEGGGFKLAAGGLMVVRLGKLGEDSVRAAYNIGDRGLFFINGRFRISDGLSRGLGTLSEIKNVESLSYTRQLRDYADYARSQNLQFILYVRQGAKLSGPLLDEAAKGRIIIRDIP